MFSINHFNLVIEYYYKTIKGLIKTHYIYSVLGFSLLIYSCGVPKKLYAWKVFRKDIFKNREV